MIASFETLPEHSRVWIYQSNRGLSAQEVIEIQQQLDQFLESWTAHGAGLKAGYEIKYNRFIIIALDQESQAASGCSIDASVHFIQSLEKKYNIDLLDKMNVSFKQGEYVAYKPLKDFKKMVKDRAVNANTIVFNNLVTTKGEYLEHWEVPASESWHARFLN
ncbi:ABC transporter ATPase [Flavobacteriaceae bacterium M23B6Z8]